MEITLPECPKCHGLTRRKTSARGHFYACTSYPACKGTVDGAKWDAEVAGTPMPVATAGPPPPLGMPSGATALWPSGIIPRAFVLDAHQQAVVDWRRGVAAVAAAAGSGKSTSLIERTLDLLREGYIPEGICLLAFNKDAAALLRSRLEQRMGKAAGRVQAFTFHAWSYSLLRHWYPDDSRLSPGRILGTPQCETHPARLLGPLMEKLAIDRDWRGALEWTDRIAEGLIDIDAPDALLRVKDAFGWEPGVANDALKTARAWREEKAQRGLLSFTDMICEVAFAIWHTPLSPHVQHLAQMYHHVMTDEGQDSNLARWTIARWLGGKPTHVEATHRALSFMVVGDLRQSVYGFSGASPELFREFAAEEGVTFLNLPVNRRSTRRIVQAANEIAENQTWNLGGACDAKPEATEGDPVVVWDTPDGTAEAGCIVEDVARRLANGASLLTAQGDSTFAVLARTNARLVELEIAFVVRKIPVRVAGQEGGIWASTVGKEFLAYLRGAEGILDWGLLDVLNKPMRRINRGLAAGAMKAGRDAGLSVIDAFRRHENGFLKRFGDVLQRLSNLRWNERCDDVYVMLKRAAGGDDLASGDQDRVAAYSALKDAAIKLGSLEAILAHQKEVAAVHRAGCVELATIHAAKGREWPVVYVASVARGVLPHKKATDREEERRLLYVAVTRGMHTTIVSQGGAPSPFLVQLGWVEPDPDDAPG